MRFAEEVGRGGRGRRGVLIRRTENERVREDRRRKERAHVVEVDGDAESNEVLTSDSRSSPVERSQRW